MSEAALLVAIPALAALCGVVVTAIVGRANAANAEASAARQALVDDQRERIDMLRAQRDECHEERDALAAKVAEAEHRPARGAGP